VPDACKLNSCFERLLPVNGQAGSNPKVRFADDLPRSVGSTFDLLVRRRLFNRNREGLSNKQGVWHSIGHVHQTRLRRDADASEQVGEPGIGAKRVP
jgi:hypothetical protein